jgi:hypothetical protein
VRGPAAMSVIAEAMSSNPTVTSVMFMRPTPFRAERPSPTRVSYRLKANPPAANRTIRPLHLA